MLRKMKVGSRLGLGFGGVIVLLLALATLGVDRMAVVIGNTQLILHDRYQKVALAHSIENELNRQARALRTALITTDVETIKGEMRKVSDADQRMQNALATITGLTHSQEGRNVIEQLLVARKAYDHHKAQLVALVVAQSLDEGAAYLVQNMLPVQDTYLAAIEAFGKMQVDGMMHFGNEATKVAQDARLATVALTFAAVVLALAIAFFMTRSITGPIARAVVVAETVAKGDLTMQIRSDRTDETGQLLTALRRMNEGLLGIVRQVLDSSGAVASGASQIASGNADLSVRTEAQVARLQETAAAMELVQAAAQNNAEHAGAAAQLAREAHAAAMQGGEVVRRMVTTVADIAANARKIAEITSSIDGIARQTNILALNAAVEGARAAEGGRGFVVVAAEVRVLAQRAAGAARDIDSHIRASVERTDAGARLAQEASEVMEGIMQHVDKVAQFIGDIDAACKQQSVGIGQTTKALGELDEATLQNAALVEESAAAAESLRGQSAKLAEVVSSFRLEASAPLLGPSLAL